MNFEFEPLDYVLPFVLAASVIEGVVLSRSRGAHYDWKATGVSMLDLIGRQLLSLLPLSLATPVFAFAWEHRLATVPLTSAWAFLALFLGQEFCYYWYHRASHRVRWFWASHVVHHSPNELNLSAAYRFGWTGRLTGTTLFYTPLVVLGFRPELVLFTLTLNLLYQFWIHAAWIPRLGPLEYLLNTPSAHRVHHASNLDYLDANYGGVLVVFDRLFGTYVAERLGEPCRYGLVKPTATHNLFRIEFDEWVNMARDVIRARNPGDVLGRLFGAPGWRPDGTGERTEDLRRQRKARRLNESSSASPQPRLSPLLKIRPPKRPS